MEGESHENTAAHQTSLKEVAELLIAAEEQKREIPRATFELVTKLRTDLAQCLGSETLEKVASHTYKASNTALTDDFSHEVERFLSERPNPSYRSALKQLQEWCVGNGLTFTRLKYSHIAHYIEDRRKTLKPSSLYAHLQIVRHFCDRLMQHGLINGNPIPILSYPNAPKNLESYVNNVLSLQEVRALLQSFDNKIANLRDRAITGVILYACIPGSSIPKLQVEDFISEQGVRYLRLPLLKGEHRVPLHPAAVKFLDEFLWTAKLEGFPHCPLFPSRVGQTTTKPLAERKLSNSFISYMLAMQGKRIHLLGNLTSDRLRRTGIVALTQADPSGAGARKFFGPVSQLTLARYQYMTQLAPSDLGQLFDGSDDIRSALLDFTEKAGLFQLSDTRE